MADEGSGLDAATSAMKPIAPKRSYAADVTRMLRQAILSGQFKDGEKLNLSALAEQLGVSIMPVREALAALANEGLVVSLPNRGFRATPLNEQDFDDVFALHAHISGILAGRAVEAVQAEDIAELRRLHDEFCRVAQADTADASALLEELNEAFHRKLNSLGSGNRLRWFLRFTSRLIPTDLYGRFSGWCSASLDYHPRIIDALEARDAALVASLVEQHLAEGIELSRPNASDPTAPE